MDWHTAIEAMKAGKHVQRASESGRKLVGHSDGVPIYECGMEPCFLAHAWSDDQRPVRVFCGSGSKALFVPESEHTEATDWFVVEPHVQQRLEARRAAEDSGMSDDDLGLRLHSLSKSLESSGRIDQHDNPDAYATVLDAMNLVAAAEFVLDEFRKTEATGASTRDRRFAIEVLSRALTAAPAGAPPRSEPPVG